MTKDEDRRPPGANRGSGDETVTATTTIISASTDDSAEAQDWQDIADRVDGAFVVLLRRPSGRRHRRCFLTLRAAQHAADLARERGEAVEVVLAELRPLYRLGPGGAS